VTRFAVWGGSIREHVTADANGVSDVDSSERGRVSVCDECERTDALRRRAAALGLPLLRRRVVPPYTVVGARWLDEFRAFVAGGAPPSGVRVSDRRAPATVPPAFAEWAHAEYGGQKAVRVAADELRAWRDATK
jgi:hypothetical protein